MDQWELWKTQSDSLEWTQPVLWDFCVGIWEQLVPGSLKADVLSMIKRIMPLGLRLARSRELAVPRCLHVNNPTAPGKV